MTGCGRDARSTNVINLRAAARLVRATWLDRLKGSDSDGYDTRG